MDAEEIVRALALHDPYYTDDEYWRRCHFCDRHHQPGPVDLEDHDTDCLWRTAREHLAQ